LRNEEDDGIAYCLHFSAVPDCTCCYNPDTHCRLDFSRVLGLGALEITNLSAARGRKITLDQNQYSDNARLFKRTRYAPAFREDIIVFRRVGSRIPEQLQCRLILGSLYSIGFTDYNIEMWCDLGEMSSLVGAHWMEPLWVLHCL